MQLTPRAALAALYLAISAGSGAAQITSLPLPPGNLQALVVLGSPAPQGAVQVEVTAIPGALVTLILGTAAQDQILAPNLTLQIVPSSITIVSNTVITPPGGKVRFSVVLPPGFPAGLLSYAQAGIVGAFGQVFLSNTVCVTTQASLSSLAPQVLSITTQSLGGLDPALANIPDGDVYVIEFSKPIDPATIDPQETLVVRNLSLTTATQPTGVVIPALATVAANSRFVMVTPVAPISSSIDQIDVAVNPPTISSARIRDPGGLALANSMSVTFTKSASPSSTTLDSVSELFVGTGARDPGFQPRFMPADWDLGGSGRLAGTAISGTALPGGPVGTRHQFTITPNGVGNIFNGATTLAFFSPFDDNGVNNLGPAVNPFGGSHLQLMYLTNGNELPVQMASSVELVEWSLHSGSLTTVVHNGVSVRMGHGSAQAASTSSLGLSNDYDSNFDFDNPQNEWILPPAHPSPQNPNVNEAPVLVVPPTTYIPSAFGVAGTFVPFPQFVLPFDFDGKVQETNVIGQLVHPNLIFDINVPGPTPPTNHFIRGTNVNTPVPTRRLIGGPGALFAFAFDPVIFHARITTVDKNSSARSLFYDTGVVAPMITSLQAQVVPGSVAPLATLTIRVEAADSIAQGNQIISGGTGIHVFRDRFGATMPSALTAVSGHRFVRFSWELESDVSTNVSPAVEGMLLGYLR